MDEIDQYHYGRKLQNRTIRENAQIFKGVLSTYLRNSDVSLIEYIIRRPR